MGDADDHLRMAQVHDWLAGQSWFDITQYRINPPDGGQMHWSRLVDLPIAAMILILRTIFNPILAERMAAAIIPLLTFGIVLWLMASITKRLFKIVATGHHRNQLAMKDVIETMIGTPETARAIMTKRKIQYLIGCNGSPELDYYRARAPDGFWSKLQTGVSYDWLEPQPMIGPYRVWRMRPGAE